MDGPASLENYPVSTVIIANLMTLLMYAIGAYVLLQVSPFLVLAYLLIILYLESRLIAGHCTDCYYYGRTCAFGKGRLSAVFCRRGDPSRFTMMQLTAKDLLPDFLVFMIPVILGLYLLAVSFSFGILAAVIALLLLGFAGNAVVRGKLACRFCRQREIGCPA